MKRKNNDLFIEWPAWAIARANYVFKLHPQQVEWMAHLKKEFMRPPLFLYPCLLIKPCNRESTSRWALGLCILVHANVTVKTSLKEGDSRPKLFSNFCVIRGTYIRVGGSTLCFSNESHHRLSDNTFLLFQQEVDLKYADNWLHIVVLERWCLNDYRLLGILKSLLARNITITT